MAFVAPLERAAIREQRPPAETGQRATVVEVGEGYGAASLLARLIARDARDVRTHEIAGRFRGADAAARVQAWVQRNIAFVRETEETFQAPWVTIARRAGDCDDHTRLVAAVLLALGYRVSLGFIDDGRGNPTHVWPLVWDGARWVDLETTAPARYGEDPRATVRRLSLARVDVTMGALRRVEDVKWRGLHVGSDLQVQGGQRVWMRLLIAPGLSLDGVEDVLARTGFTDVAVFAPGVAVDSPEPSPREWSPDPLAMLTESSAGMRVVRAVATYARPQSAVIRVPLVAGVGRWVSVLTAWTREVDAPAMGAVAPVGASELDAARRATSWVSDAVLRRLVAFAPEVGADPFDIAAVIQHESGWKPWAKSSSGTAAGLIQWLAEFAPVPSDRLVNMTADQQWPHVESWFRSKRGLLGAPWRTYLAVFNPGKLTATVDEDTILYDKTNPKHARAIRDNPTLVGADGNIRVGNLGRVVEATKAKPGFQAIALRLRSLGATPRGGGGGLLAGAAVAAVVGIGGVLAVMTSKGAFA